MLKIFLKQARTHSLNVDFSTTLDDELDPNHEEYDPDPHADDPNLDEIAQRVRWDDI